MALIQKYKKIIVASAVVIAAVALLGVYSLYMSPDIYPAVLPTTTITVGGVSVKVELATTEADRERGLSGRAGLSSNAGMLFVFDTPGKWAIWMKDMNFPIDIIWADANGTIVTIEPGVLPSTYPSISFAPASLSEYVLEVPAGFAKAHNVGVGSEIVVQ